MISAVACVCIITVFVQYRQWSAPKERPLVVTTWDAFGYYVYLPAFFIYNDAKTLNWLDSTDRKYHLTGGNGWQAEKLENGNYTFKYLGGVAIMQMPLFLIGHFVAGLLSYPQDGFSPPYQYAITLGALIYCLLGLLVLRRVLLRYFDDIVVTVTLLLTALATNLMQYAADDNGQSHVYIFMLYAVVLAATDSWHRKPRAWIAFAVGYIIGLATMSRPTEAIMLLIPLLWNTNGKSVTKEKWRLVWTNKPHVWLAVIGGLVGILPQLIYWKYSTESFIYDVGSKWVFFNPWFRVLFGWEKGWFIYTPVTIFFVIGLFFLKKYPFKNAILWFFILNLWIIISWEDWRYGGSYSTRALVQSYPVMAFSLASLIAPIFCNKGRYIALLLGSVLIVLNVFQTIQYHRTILHYNDMNRQYYGRIFMNANPSAEDMSLLDNGEFLYHESAFEVVIRDTLTIDTTVTIAPKGQALIATKPIQLNADDWIKLESIIEPSSGLWNSYLTVVLKTSNTSKTARIRLFSPIAKENTKNRYALFMHMPPNFQHTQLSVFITTTTGFSGRVYRTCMSVFRSRATH